jgi:phospholipase C
VAEGGRYDNTYYLHELDDCSDANSNQLIVVAPFTKAGHISHSYTDHASIIKFIEYNWKLGTISGRSRDNLPNPQTTASNPYVPTNSPALGDLTDLFSFGSSQE